MLFVVVVLLAVSWPVIDHEMLRRRSDPVAEALAELPYRPTVARLSPTTRYASYERRVRPDVAREVKAALADHPFPSRLDQHRVAGVAKLLTGDAVGALRQLAEAVALAESEPVGPERRAAILNDFAAAQFESGDAKGQVIGLDAIEKAWALDRTPAIAWTRAVLLSSLASPDAGARAWDDYLTLDRRSPWTVEAKQRRDELYVRRAKVLTASAPIAIIRNGDGSRAIERYDRMLDQLLRAGRHDRAAAVLLVRAETLSAMRATDEAWADLVRARRLISGRTVLTGQVLEALAVAAARDGYLRAARVLFADAMADTDMQTHACLSQWQAYVRARIAGGSAGAYVSLLPQTNCAPSSELLRAAARLSPPSRGETSGSAVSELFAESVQSLYERQSRIEIANGSSVAALWLSDQARGAPIRSTGRCGAGLRGESVEKRGRKLARCIPPGVTIVYQDLDADHLHTWVVRNGNIAFTTAPVSAARLLAQIERLPDDSRERRFVYDVLLRPVEHWIAGSELLVFSPSANLRNVPFAALHDGKAFLVQRHRVMATTAISSFELPYPSERTASALVVLPDAAPGVRDLRGARREVRAVDAVYGRRATLWTGDAATPETFLGHVLEYDILHLSSHGYASDLPYQNGIDFGRRRIRAYDVLRLRLDRAPVVMLAACRTGSDGGRPTNVSLAQAFLRAGSSAVVGSLWNVEDEDTADLSIAFHRELARGATPQDALRTVQLQFIRDGKPISSWAAFQVSS
ncbi:MAG TPA: CHAT domain-containing protein [Thermoanaerobaculia bacterium]|nr:CHAT domain-containing protein [Thermoanaerobaculia bacterium]